MIRDALTNLSSTKILDIVPLVYHPERNESDDSDDGVDIPDNEKVNPFTSLDLQLLKNSYRIYTKNIG